MKLYIIGSTNTLDPKCNDIRFVKSFTNIKWAKKYLKTIGMYARFAVVDIPDLTSEIPVELKDETNTIEND